MGAGTLVGGVSVYLIRKIQHRVLRAPPSLVLTGALCAVGSIGGALGGISLSNYNEKKVRLERQLGDIGMLHCPIGLYGLGPSFQA